MTETLTKSLGQRIICGISRLERGEQPRGLSAWLLRHWWAPIAQLDGCPHSTTPTLTEHQYVWDVGWEQRRREESYGSVKAQWGLSQNAGPKKVNTLANDESCSLAEACEGLRGRTH